MLFPACVSACCWSTAGLVRHSCSSTVLGSSGKRKASRGRACGCQSSPAAKRDGTVSYSSNCSPTVSFLNVGRLLERADSTQTRVPKGSTLVSLAPGKEQIACVQPIFSHGKDHAFARQRAESAAEDSFGRASRHGRLVAMWKGQVTWKCLIRAH